MLVAAIGCVASLLGSIVLIEASRTWPRPTPIAGDPTLYGEIADAILGGAVPYIDVTVEHLPVLLVPIVAVGLAAWLSGLAYAALWPLVTIGAVIGSVALAGRLPYRGYQWYYTLAILPMLPLVIYRLEIFVVLLALAALAAFAVERATAGTMWTLLGGLAKGWPLVLLVIPLRRGRIRLALGGLAIAVVILGAIAVLPGFREGRAFSGIHTETIVGNLLLVARHAMGDDLGLIGAAGATYVEAPWVAVAVNATLGLLVGIVALRQAFTTTDVRRLIAIAGLATIAVMLMSPLFSAQFVFWLAPFVPLMAARTRVAYGIAAAMSMLVAALWNPFEAWWALEVAVRNVALVVTTFLWIADITRTVPRDVADELAVEHVS
jgi:hypothetical protein